MIIQPLVNEYKLKYSIMNKLLQEKKINDNYNFVNIYINLDTIFKSFHRGNNIDAIRDLKQYDRIALSAEIMNVVAHYRHLFFNYHNTKTVFYLYSLTSRFNHAKNYVKKYGDHVFDKMSATPENIVLRTFELDNTRLVKILCQYIPDVYFIASNGLEPGVNIYKIISALKNADKICNIVLSNEELDYQLLNLKNTYLIDMRYDKSKIYDSGDIYYKTFKKIKYRPENKFDPKLYSLLYAIMGYKKRNINKIDTTVSALKHIDKAITNKDIFNAYPSNIEYVSNILYPEYKKNLINNFSALDYNLNVNLMSKKNILYIKNSIVDRYDNIALMELNNTYYNRNNLHLVELFEGC